MAAFTSLAIGLGLGALGGALLARKKKPAAPTGETVTAPEATPAEQVAKTNPPNAIAGESAAMAGARMASARQRRRAAAGSAGRVVAGKMGGSAQGSAYAGGVPRTLLGS